MAFGDDVAAYLGAPGIGILIDPSVVPPPGVLQAGVNAMQASMESLDDATQGALNDYTGAYPGFYAFVDAGIVTPDLKPFLLAIDAQKVRFSLSDTVGFFSQALLQFSPINIDLPPPTITNAVPHPANASRGNSITITWSANVTYNKYLIWWTVNGFAQPQGEVDVEGTTGSWTAGTEPGYKYVFSVNGGQSSGIFGNYNYSGWGPQTEVFSVPNLRNLRAFLVAGNADFAGKSIHAIMSPYRSLLIYMDLRKPDYEGPATGDPNPGNPYSIYTDH